MTEEITVWMLMELSIRLKILDRLYAIYDEFVGSLDVSCRIHCTHCCTRNVTLTTLEGYKMMAHLSSHNLSNVLPEIKSARRKKRFQPKMTTNCIAQLCKAGHDLPEECIPSAWGPCPLLREDICPLYLLRPFGCRCMISTQNCFDTGYAEMEDFVITVNTVFFQIIEHLDADGCSGNLTDILLCMATSENRQAYRANRLSGKEWRLIQNQPMTVLMIPPGHRRQIEPILDKIRSVT